MAAEIHNRVMDCLHQYDRLPYKVRQNITAVRYVRSQGGFDGHDAWALFDEYVARQINPGATIRALAVEIGDFIDTPDFQSNPDRNAPTIDAVEGILAAAFGLEPADPAVGLSEDQP